MYMKTKIFGIFIMVLAATSLATTQERQVYPLKEIKVGAADLGVTNLPAILRWLSTHTDVTFCQEETFKTPDILDHLTIALSVSDGDNLVDVLERLQSQYSVMWRVVGNIIVIQTPELPRLKDNPLDARIKPFDFSGTLVDLISYLNEQVPELLANEFSDSIDLAHGSYHLSFKSEAAVREILSTMTRQYGIQWSAAIRPEVEHRMVKIGNDPHEVDLARRVDLAFAQGPLLRLVR
jgi:hypothetical protein